MAIFTKAEKRKRLFSHTSTKQAFKKGDFHLS
jgi:hypothetical protein